MEPDPDPLSRCGSEDPDPLLRKGGSEDPDPDPLFLNVGPRIRIRIHVKMRWIRNADNIYCSEKQYVLSYLHCHNGLMVIETKVQTDAQRNVKREPEEINKSRKTL